MTFAPRSMKAVEAALAMIDTDGTQAELLDLMQSRQELIRSANTRLRSCAIGNIFPAKAAQRIIDCRLPKTLLTIVYRATH